MPYPRTPAQNIQIGQVSMYLSLVDVAKKKALEGIPYYDQQLPVLIALETDVVNWQYEMDSTDSTLRETSDYLYALCGRYALDAQNVINAGGVVVTPVEDVSNYLIKQRAYPQFIVGAVDSPMVDGDTVLEIVDELAVLESRDGEVEIHVDGGELGQMLLDRSSYTPVYETGKYTITFRDPVRDGMLIMVDYPVRMPLVFTGSIAPPTDDQYIAVLVDFEIRTLLNTAGNIFTIPAGTQGILRINLAGTSTLDERLAAVWEYYVNNIGGTITLSLSTGGIIYQTFASPMDGNIAINANNTLQGVEIVGTGQIGSTITLTATFNYAPFGI